MSYMLTSLGKAVHLMKQLYDCEYEYPGYGCLHWPTGRVYNFGTANRTIGIDVYESDEHFAAGEPATISLDTGVLSSEENPNTIAGAVLTQIFSYERSLSMV